MYTATHNLKDIGRFPTLVEAFNELAKKVKEDFGNKVLTWQALETCCWIKRDGASAPLCFYDARDMAIDQGWKQEMMG